MSEIAVADLFCGAGGMSSGFQDFFDVTLAIDWEQDPCNTYRHNLSGVVRQRDVRDMSGSRKDFDGIVGIIGGPSCRPFSKLNTKKRADDERQHLWKYFMQYVAEVQPDFFLMENVPTIYLHIKKSVKRLAKEMGYHVVDTILDSSEYGVPQTRKRWIVVGSKKPFKFPEPTYQFVTVRDAFARVKENDGFFGTKPETLEKFKDVPIGKWVAISSGRFRNAIRLTWNQVSPTVVNTAKVYMIHPSENRVITEREAAVLQDFPYDYKFYGARKSRCQQIGDAAPSSLMREIAEQIFTTQYGGM